MMKELGKYKGKTIYDQKVKGGFYLEKDGILMYEGKEVGYLKSLGWHSTPWIVDEVELEGYGKGVFLKTAIVI